MEPKDAAQVCAQASNTLIHTISETTHSYALRSLSEGLSAVATGMEPKEAAQAAVTLAQAMSKTRDSDALGSLSEGLAAVAARMDPKDAVQVYQQVANTLIQVMSTTNYRQRLEELTEGLSAVVANEASSTRRQRLMRLTAAVAMLAGPRPPFATLAWTQPVLDPPPSLPPQMLVDILKNPFCVGEARRLVLEQLTRHYNRPFADQWEFVDYVHTHKLDLDLTTPPERPKWMP